MSFQLRTPVAFVIFNRPDRAARVFEAIKAARPPKLFVIADGPRPASATDNENCTATRAVVDRVDWPCEVVRRFADANIGLRRNVAEGMDWVFGQTASAIILEDDCVPDPTFFQFCEELLERYAEDAHVGAISGTNLDPAKTASPDTASYYFSRFCHIWGWATWQRAWRLCDHEVREWATVRDTNWLSSRVETRTAENFWRRQFDDSLARHPHGLNTWDVAWVFSCWRHQMLSVVPRSNLVANLGFGADATHTKRKTRAANVPVVSMRFPLRHPAAVEVNAEADRHIQKNLFEGVTPAQRLYWKLRLPLPIWLVRRVLRWFAR
jgi:hypothetical protein